MADPRTSIDRRSTSRRKPHRRDATCSVNVCVTIGNCLDVSSNTTKTADASAEPTSIGCAERRTDLDFVYLLARQETSNASEHWRDRHNGLSRVLKCNRGLVAAHSHTARRFGDIVRADARQHLKLYAKSKTSAGRATCCSLN